MTDHSNTFDDDGVIPPDAPDPWDENAKLRGALVHWQHEVGKLHSQVDRLRTALDAAEARHPTVAVKPLVWRVQSSDCQVADTPWGSAAVQNESHALAPNRWGWWVVGSGEDDSPSGYGDDIESAKAAAQADYAARILAALVTPARPTVAEAARVPEIAALITAARRASHATTNDGLTGRIYTDEAVALQRALAALRAIAGGDANG